MNLSLPSRLAALAAALLCAAPPLPAQDRPAQALIPVASTPDGIELSIDSAAVRRTGDSTFFVAAVYRFPDAVARQTGSGRRVEAMEVDCARGRQRGRYAMLDGGERLAEPLDGDTAGLFRWAAAGAAELPTHRATCEKLLGSFAASLPVTREIGGVDAPPRLANTPEIRRYMGRFFPPQFRDAAKGGVTLMRVRITESGSVDPASVSALASTDRAFADASADLIRRMHFTPAKVNGQPVSVWITVPVTFGFEP